MSNRRAVGKCADCHCWGGLTGNGTCTACRYWEPASRPSGRRCQRCGHRARLNRNQLCRLCLVTIRTVDQVWITRPQPQQPTQLFLLLAGVRLPTARGFNRGEAAAARPAVLPPRNPSWVVSALPSKTADDPDICPRLPPGQLMLLHPRHTITLELAGRITNRSIPGHDRVAEIAKAYADELSNSAVWRGQVTRLLRLTLAVAEAEGRDRVPEEWLVDAPLRETLAEVLRRADLLAPWTGVTPPPRQVRSLGRDEPRSCEGMPQLGHAIALRRLPMVA